MAKATSGDTPSSTAGDSSNTTTAADGNVTADATGTAAPAGSQPASTETTTADAPVDASAADASSVDVSNLPDSADKAQDGGLYVGDLDLGTGAEDTEELRKAREQAKEEEAARLANPNKAVYRKNEDPAFFQVGQVVEDEKPQEG